MSENEINLAAVLQTVMRGWKLLVGIMVVAFVVALIYALSLPPQWTAEAVLIVNRSKAGEQPVQLDATDLEMDTFAEFVLTPEVLQAALDHFKLGDKPFRLNRERLARVVRCQPRRNTNLLDLRVTFSGRDEKLPELATEVCNFLAQQGEQLKARLLEAEADRSLDGLRKVYESQQADFMQARDTYLKWYESVQIHQDEGEIENGLLVIREIETTLSEDRAKLVGAQARLQMLQAILEREPAALKLKDVIGSDPRMTQVALAGSGQRVTDILSATMTREVLNPGYQTAIESLVEAQSQIPEMTSRITDQEHALEVIRQRISDTEKRHNANLVLRTVEEALLAISKLNLETVSDIYQAAMARIITNRQDLLMLSPAQPPLRPTGPRRGVIIVSAVLAVLLAGVTFLLLYDALDRRGIHSGARS